MAIDITDDPFIAGFVAQGVAQGEGTWRAEEARKILLAVLRTREIEMSEADSLLVDSCADLIQLEHWTERAALAITAAAVFGVRPHLPAQTARPIAAA